MFLRNFMINIRRNNFSITMGQNGTLQATLVCVCSYNVYRTVNYKQSVIIAVEFLGHVYTNNFQKEIIRVFNRNKMDANSAR